jgi:Protein of unknown function (DUF2924)
MTENQLMTALAQIDEAAPAELDALWQQTMRGPKPAHPLICRYTLAWELRARVYGGLTAATQRRLRDLARAFERDPDFHPAGVTPIKPGTEFRRVWNGHMHRVRVTAQGFEYDGKVYRSLSKVARQITGTAWSGPEFFGTQVQASKSSP